MEYYTFLLYQTGGRQPQFFLWAFHYCFRTFFRCGKYLYTYSSSKWSKGQTCRKAGAQSHGPDGRKTSYGCQAAETYSGLIEG